MTKDYYDIVIAGGGPAGLFLAKLLGERFRILLLDKNVWSEDGLKSGQKACGGLIAPDAQKMLAVLGLSLPKDLLVNPQIFAVRVLDLDNHLERYYQRHYLNIDRAKFDGWLWAQVPEAVEMIEGAFFRNFKEDKDGLSVNYSKEGKDSKVKTKLLVGADGAFSQVRTKFSEEKSSLPRLYVAIQEWFKQDSIAKKDNYYGAIFDSEITDFYSWTIPKDDYCLIGSALAPGAQAVARFEKLKAKLENHGYAFSQSKPVLKESAHIYRPQRAGQIFLGKNKVALVGEAAGFISPSSAEGFSFAFQSALALAHSVQNSIDDWEERYRKEVSQLKLNIAWKNLKAKAMYVKSLRNFIMRSGWGSIRCEQAPKQNSKKKIINN